MNNDLQKEKLKNSVDKVGWRARIFKARCGERNARFQLGALKTAITARRKAKKGADAVADGAEKTVKTARKHPWITTAIIAIPTAVVGLFAARRNSNSDGSEEG
jgi:hypothetical protein